MARLSTPAIRAVALALVAVGLAHRLAFFSWPGFVLVAAGFALLAVGGLAPRPRDGRSMSYPVLFLVLCVVAALAPFDPNGINVPEAVMTIGAGVVFYLLGVTPRVRPFRLPAAGLLLVAAHAHFLVRFPQPQHEDVFHFLNGGVDLLMRGQNPYAGVPIVEGGVNKVLRFTYPPGVLVDLAPFRVLLGDVRWAYVAAELLVIATWCWAQRRSGATERWREALVLVPLAIPRASQAFFIFSNHEWVLLALAILGLAAAWRSRWLVCAVLLGLGIASKQYFVIFPVAFLLPSVRLRSALVAGGVAVAICLPFLAWNPARFLTSVFGNLTLASDSERLTLYAAASHLGLLMPRAVQAAVSALALLSTAWLAYRTRHDLSAALMACGLSLAVFTFCSPFAAYNYYVYALVFVTWGLLTAGFPAQAVRPRVVEGAPGR